MSTLQIDRKAFYNLMQKVDAIAVAVNANRTINLWMDEKEVMETTGLGKDALRIRRKNGVFNYSTATGRKIKYLRSDVEDYLNNNSTIKKSQLA